METLFELRNASRRISETFALKNISVSLRPGEILGFVGANGAGKTTVIRALLGLLHLDSGEVRLFGQPFGADAPAAAQRQARSRIGVVFDTCPFPPEVTVKQAAACVAPAFGQWDNRTFAQLIDEFGISQKAKVRDLSRGMGMKLQLACALAHNADLLVLDEATAGLDPLARDQVLDRLRDFTANGTRGVLLSSHITSDLERVADRVAGINDGRILFDLPRETITDTAGIAHCTAEQAKEVLEVFAGSDTAEGAAERAGANGAAGNNCTDATTASGTTSPNALGISTPRVIRRAFCTDVLVPDRFAFAQAFPEIPCDRATIDEYLQFALQGTTQR